MTPTRRELLAAMPASAAALAQTADAGRRPNIIIVISDQFRWDCVGAMGLNPMNLTPNLDRMAGRGVLFQSAICNQPVCAPARGSMFTGQYPTRHGVWKNGLGLAENATTLATILRQQGYSANYIGKWHLAPGGGAAAAGPVAAADRGGFLDLWEAANALELTSHAYEGDLFDNDGKPIHFSGQYRTDFMTGRAQRFLRSARQPFLLTLSYLEVHHQNDTDTFDPPKEYAKRFVNSFVPQDLRPLPGSWPSQLPDYYGCVAKMDDTIGTIRRTLAETGLEQNTILAFLSDHACHFKTRNSEYKRSPHESSIHIPLIIEGPGFNRGLRIPELVSQVDLTPTLLTAVGLPVPASMQGRSFLPLLDRRTEGWRDEVFFEMSEFVTGRGLRTPQYTYAVMAPKQPGWRAVPAADRYAEYMLYDLAADPYQQVNLAGRVPYQRVAEELRARLIARNQEATGAAAQVDPCWFPYS
ncbi:Sulfatase [Candidatus Sulfopaludibacter sp. SbA4]|nr:Sulfatase [Candidatus Sulfopaludibacter sp. SbA4]